MARTPCPTPKNLRFAPKQSRYHRQKPRSRHRGDSAIMAERIPVTVPDSKPYEIVIERGLLKRLGEAAADFGLDGSVIVATNTTLAPLYGQQLVTRLPKAAIAYMEDGEAFKNLDTISRFYDQFLKQGADRHTTILALGG